MHEMKWDYKKDPYKSWSFLDIKIFAAEAKQNQNKHWKRKWKIPEIEYKLRNMENRGKEIRKWGDWYQRFNFFFAERTEKNIVEKKSQRNNIRKFPRNERKSCKEKILVLVNGIIRLGSSSTGKLWWENSFQPVILYPLKLSLKAFWIMQCLKKIYAINSPFLSYWKMHLHQWRNKPRRKKTSYPRNRHSSTEGKGNL